jgi:pimeloyl-ACP methyl ester carboxylesterase
VPVLFLHGNPTTADDWLPFLEALDGPALAPDLPAFGRSERPDSRRFDCSMRAYGTWVEALLDAEGSERCSLVVHDWGTVGLLAALARPKRIARLVIVNAVPLLPGYRWHWVARIWRRRGLGEAFNALASKRATMLLMRQARPGFRAMPAEFVEGFWPYFDRATRQAVLRLYRSADPDELAAAGYGLGRLDCPALVVWGLRDPYLPGWIGRAYAKRLPGARLVEAPDAGHWPWIDRPDIVERIVSFVTAG